MIVSKSRTRFPCFVGGCAAIIAGGFSLALPVLDSVRPIGWLWFCLWIASLPVLVACFVSLVVLTTKDTRLLAVTVLGGVAMVSNISPALAFLDAAAAGVVDAGDKTKTLDLKFKTATDATNWSLRELAFKEWIEAVTVPGWTELHKSETEDFYFAIFRSGKHLMFCQNDRKDAYRGKNQAWDEE